MKAYCYLDVEGTLVIKTAEYIEMDNPAFWKINDHFILRVWKFDTEDMSSIHRMFTGFKELKLSADLVKRFADSINIHIPDLKAYASSLQQ